MKNAKKKKNKLSARCELNQNKIRLSRKVGFNCRIYFTFLLCIFKFNSFIGTWKNIL